MREERIKVSDPILDKQEMDWWDTNASIIENIWALNLDLQKIIRLPYLKKMKQFFTSSAKHLPVKILEIGCGSGWVCRLVADENFHVIGTDFSAGQLEIASSKAKFYHKEKFCKYELSDASAFPKDIDGVIIHALLHHLSVEELNFFFKQLAKIPSSTKVFIYEPVFIKQQQALPSFRDKVLNRIITNLKKFSIDRAKAIGSPDNDLNNALEKIYKDAEEYGWYISPKEIPFYQDELTDYLAPHFNTKNVYIVNKSDLEVSQALILNKIEKPDFVFSKILIPLLLWFDKLAFQGNFTFYISPLAHQFVCFELERK